MRQRLLGAIYSQTREVLERQEPILLIRHNVNNM
jgi:hypothetical protein